ncbi:MAG: hypothetical protein HY460_01960 [Parcubacteria group bacterium]|nr:hypothetical protein [Parcubacteria group bacterium]
MKTFVAAYLFIVFLTPLVLPSETSAQECVTDDTGYCLEVPLPAGFPTKLPGPAEYIQNLYTLGIKLAGIVALVVLVIAGAAFIFSPANAALISEAKSRILFAIIGLLILLGSWIILNAINPDFLTLNDKNLEEKFPSLPDDVTWEELSDRIRGTKKEGDICTHHNECVSPLTCLNPKILTLDPYRRCIPRQKEGGFCEENRNCEKGYVCEGIVWSWKHCRPNH